jgi:hypothetical protein
VILSPCIFYLPRPCGKKKKEKPTRPCLGVLFDFCFSQVFDHKSTHMMQGTCEERLPAASIPFSPRTSRPLPRTLSEPTAQCSRCGMLNLTIRRCCACRERLCRDACLEVHNIHMCDAGEDTAAHSSAPTQQTVECALCWRSASRYSHYCSIECQKKDRSHRPKEQEHDQEHGRSYRRRFASYYRYNESF